jgi:cytochrome c oxidase assembly protein Cox11
MKHLSFAVFVIILSFVLLPSCDLFCEKNKVDTTELEELKMQLARLDSIRVADSLKMVQETQKAQARQDSIRLAEEVRSASKYHIIVGTFYTPE